MATNDSTTTATIIDTTPPMIESVTNTLACLWPPNHELVRYDLGDQLQVVTHDACDPSPVVTVASVTSSEPAMTPGSGDTSPDVFEGLSAFCVRSERAGPGDGRVYTVEVVATNFAGNVSAPTSTTIDVPHDQGQAQRYPNVPQAAEISAGDPRCDFSDGGNPAISAIASEDPSPVAPAHAPATEKHGCGSAGGDSLLALYALMGLLVRRRGR